MGKLPKPTCDPSVGDLACEGCVSPLQSNGPRIHILASMKSRLETRKNSLRSVCLHMGAVALAQRTSLP